MSEQNIKPEKITKPIQLLGAWLAGLLSIDSCFLIAATNMDPASFGANALVLAAIANVPIFLIAVFILQTKFRPELQEDSYYSTYLNQKTNEKVTVVKSDSYQIDIIKRLALIEAAISAPDKEELKENNYISILNIGINKYEPDIDAIKAKLKGAGATSYSTFGSDSMPKQKILAMSYGLNIQAQKELREFAGSIGYTHYSYYHNHEEDITEDALIGAYGMPEHELL